MDQMEQAPVARERRALSASDLIVIKQACRVPAKQLLSDKERKFVKETKERLGNFGERLYVSAGQFAWLEKIAKRAQAGNPAKAGAVNGFPDYNELAGE